MLQLVIVLICGFIAAAIASGKGRNVVGWFFGGFFLGIIGIIIVAVLPNLKEQKAHRSRVAMQQRRLAEQLRQERIKSEAYRRYTTSRLDTHDEALGMDTRTLPGSAPPAPALESLANAVESPPPAPAGDPSHALQRMADGVQEPMDHTEWHYEMHGRPYGPESSLGIVNLIQRGVLTPETLVWSEGMADWTPAREIEPFRSEVRS